jgi:hypothetical protein
VQGLHLVAQLNIPAIKLLCPSLVVIKVCYDEDEANNKSQVDWPAVAHKLEPANRINQFHS